MDENNKKITVVDFCGIRDDATLSKQQIDEIAVSLSEAGQEEIDKINQAKENADEIVDEGNDDGIASELKDINLDSTYEDLLGSEYAGLPESDIDLFSLVDGKPLISDEDIENRAKDNLSKMMDLPDIDIVEFCSLFTKYRKDKSSVPNIYGSMPPSIRKMIDTLCTEQGLPFTKKNEIAKMFLEEFISEAEVDETFVNIEKSIDEALKMPSISDMYSEHTNEVMNVKIPEIIEKIKDTEPEHAKVLQDIRDEFTKAYNLDELKSHLEFNTRTRKLMRRDFDDPHRFCDEFNLKNSHSQFKMPDCNNIIAAVDKVIKDAMDSEEESRISTMAITDIDVNKFVILFCRSAMDRDPDKLTDAAYMYYLVRNVTSLELTNDAKTEFAAQLINNICDIIELIREKEAEFGNANNSKKSGKRKSAK